MLSREACAVGGPALRGVRFWLDSRRRPLHGETFQRKSCEVHVDKSSLNRLTPTTPRRGRPTFEILAVVIVSDSWAAMNHSSKEGSSPGQQQGPRQAPGEYGQVPTSHSSPASEIRIEIDSKRLRAYARTKAGEQTLTVRSAADETKGNRLAYVHVPQDGPNGGRQARPPFTVSGPNAELLCSVRPSGSGVYEVYGGDGAPIGRITRLDGRALPWPRRPRWTVQAVTGGEPLTAERGTPVGWALFTVFSPVYLVIWALGALQGLVPLLFGDKDEAKKESAWDLGLPSRALWRASGHSEVVVDYRGGGIFHIESSRLDSRLAYAQSVLHVWDGV